MEEKRLNFAFWGTPDVASETLEILKSSGYIPGLIVTSPDRPAGRKMVVTPPPVKMWAEVNNVPFIQPEKLGALELKGGFDLFLVIAYGKIIPEGILNLPKLGSYNIHYSLLPRYRGASPVESAILEGDSETGVTVQKMRFKLDSGPIVAQEKVEVRSDEKAPELRERLIKAGGELLVKTLPKIIKGVIREIEQGESGATFSKKIKKEDGLIDLAGNPVKNYNKFRAYYGWPRVFFFQNSKRIIITDAKLENDQFVIKKVLPEGRKEIKYEEFLRANI